MTIHIQCSECSREFQLPDGEAGQEVECACGNRLDVPAPVNERFTSQVDLHCPRCHRSYRIETQDPDEQVECQCGQLLTADSPAPALPQDLTDEQFPEHSAEPETKPESAEESAGSHDEVTTIRRQKDKPVSPLMIVGTLGALCFVLAAGIVISGNLNRTEPPKVAQYSQPESDKENTVPPQIAPPQADQPEETEEPEEDANPPRLTLAQRIERAEGKAVINDDSPKSGDTQAEVEVAPRTGNGPATSNPYSKTNTDEFVDLESGRAQQSVASNPAARTKTQEQSASKPARSQPDQSQAPATTAEAGTDNGKADSPPTAAPILIPFTQPQRIQNGFDRAARVALKSFAELRGLGADIKGADTKGADTKSKQKSVKLAETGGLLRVAHLAADAEADSKEVARVRLMLAWCYQESGQLHEAAVLSRYLMQTIPSDMVIHPPEEKSSTATAGTGKRPPKADGVGAALVDAASRKKKGNEKAADLYPRREAALLALAVLGSIYDSSDPEARDSEYRQIVEVAELIHSDWPGLPQADDMRMTIARLHLAADNPVQAAKWFVRITKKSSDYGRARLAAGQIFYTRHLQLKKQNNGDTDEAPAAEAARRTHVHLTAGLEHAREDASLRDQVYLAAFTLAQMAVNQQEYETGLRYFTTEPSLESMAKEVAGAARPATGIHSAAVASAVLGGICRCHLQLGQRKKAAAALTTLLQSVPPEASNEQSAVVCADLATRFSELCATSDAVGDDIDDQSDSSNVDMLAAAAACLMRVADDARFLPAGVLLDASKSAASLAESIGEQEDSAVLYGVAVRILKGVLDQAPQENRRAIRYRMAQVMVPAGQWEEAFVVFQDMLKEKPNVVDVQIHAVAALQLSGKADSDAEKLRAALRGDSKLPNVWGWQKICQLLRRQLEGDSAGDDYLQRYADARNGLARCRLDLALLLESEKERKSLLNSAALELETFSRRTNPDQQVDWSPLQGTYDKICVLLKRPQKSLSPVSRKPD